MLNTNSQRLLKPGTFYGEILGLDRGCGFQLSDARYEGGKQLPEHSHELAFFCLLVKGSYTENYGRRSVSYGPLTVAFHPPGETHKVEMSRDGGYIFNVEIQHVLLDRLREYAPLPNTLSDLHGGEMAWLSARLFREYRMMKPYSPLAIEGLVLEMLAAAARGAHADEKKAPAWMSRVIELLHAEFCENLTVNYVASVVGVHPIYLSKVFRQFQHQTVGEYVHKLRIHAACQQLCQTEAALADIALSVGFSDQSHFTRVFKRMTGSTPGDMRDSFRL